MWSFTLWVYLRRDDLPAFLMLRNGGWTQRKDGEIWTAIAQRYAAAWIWYSSA